MKKIFRSLITIALCAPLLGGCAFLDWLDDDGSGGQNQTAEKTKLVGLELSEYSTEVEKGSTYTYDGKITAKYEGGGTAELKNEDCTFSTISTNVANKMQTLKVSYTDKYKENGSEKEVTEKAEAKINVISTLQSISASSIGVGRGRTKTLNVEFEPSDATYKDLTFSSNNESVATVDSKTGAITGHSDGTAKITVTSVKYPNITTEVNITVAEVVPDAWTILLYLCGADLESGGDYGVDYGGAATADIQEILSVSGQPDDVNILIQTGGAKAWQTKYGISSSYNQRYHVENRALVKDNDKVYTTYKSMGLSDTLKDFLNWGLSDEFLADNYGLILWNHGGGLAGVCYDEKKSDDSLTNDEVVTAVSSALSTNGLSKLEFIGYDACLMQMAEIAEFNAPYFKYQIASQESEAGSGWDYNTWIDDLYAKKSTENILKAIVDGFITDNGGVNGTGYNYQGKYYKADQTLSYLDLSQISTFKTAWEALASQISSKITSGNKSTFKNNVVGASKAFAGDDYDYFGEFDIYDFLTKLSSNSTFNPGGNYISNVQSALSNLVKYNVVQLEGAADAHGLSFSFGANNSSDYTHFTNWLSIIDTVGGFSQSSWW